MDHAYSGPADQRSKVLFISGWGRSGSTLLDRLLGQFSDVVSVGEVRDIWQRGVLEDRLCGCGERFSACPFWSEVGNCAFGGWGALDIQRMQQLRRTLDRPWMVPLLLAGPPPVLRRAMTEYTTALSRLYHAIGHVGQAKVIVDSSKIASFALLLGAAGQPLRTLHLVRDSRGVIHSWRKQVKREDGGNGEDYLHRYNALAGSLRYVMYNLQSHLLAARGVPYRRVRYEDLATRTQTTLDQIAAFAEVDRASVHAAANGEDRPTATSHMVDGNPMRLRQGPVHVRLDEVWRTGLPRPVRWLVTAVTAPLLMRYGYLGRRNSRKAHA